jgi:uncharacterized membrane protein
MDELQRDLGRVEGRMEAMDARLERIEANLITVVEHVQQSKGGMRALTWLGTIAGAVGAGIATVAGWFISASGHP